MIQFNYTLLYNIILYIMSMTMYYNLLNIFITGNYITLASSVNPFSNTLLVNNIFIPRIEY